MANIGWIIASVSTAALITVVGIIVILRILRDKKSGFPLQKERTISRELATLGSTLVVLGIVFGTDRLIGYSFIGAGGLPSIISVIKSRRKNKNLLWRRGELMKKNTATNSWQYAILALGVSVCLIGALLMAVGEGILGENHTGIATVIGIVGIGLIARSTKGR